MKHIWPETVVWLLLDKSQKMHDMWGILTWNFRSVDAPWRYPQIKLTNH
jgi:hypothetical protein